MIAHSKKMDNFEIEKTLNTMRLLIDTREHQTGALQKRIEQIGLPFDRCALRFGDYSAKFTLPTGDEFSLADKCVIERKQSLTEVCGNFCQGRERFVREFQRAKEAKARIYLLIEGASWRKIINGSYRSQMSPQALTASLLAWLARYDCRLIFCEAEQSGILIKNILYREAKERLEKL